VAGKRPGSKSRSGLKNGAALGFHGGDSLTQRIMDQLEEERQEKQAAIAKRKAVTLPKLKCLEDDRT
jgi:hypothetical protein